MKIAVIGDFHVPSRAREVPKFVYNKIREEEPDLILCTGDVGEKGIINKLEEIAELKIVRGNMDNLNLPESIEIEVNNRKILMIHGDQVNPRGNEDQLYYIAEDEEADILVTGHTHIMKTTELNDILLVNPGSATGAWSGGGANPEPSFLTMEMKNNKVNIKKISKTKEEEEIYELH